MFLRVVCDFKPVSYSKDLITWQKGNERVDICDLIDKLSIKQQATENIKTAWKQQKYWNSFWC